MTVQAKTLLSGVLFSKRQAKIKYQKHISQLIRFGVDFLRFKSFTNIKHKQLSSGLIF